MRINSCGRRVGSVAYLFAEEINKMIVCDLNIAVICSVGINTVKGPCVSSGYSVVVDDMSAIGSVTRYKDRSALFGSSRTLYFAVLERAVLSAVDESDG